MRAYKGSSALHISQTVATDWRKTAFTAQAISLLNPHVYLDTVLLLGGVGALLRISVNSISRFGVIRSLFHLLFHPCQFYLK